jgi:hypothetical protein
MQEERRPLDPTRRLLRVFGVKVTDYEEKTAAILERAAAAPSDAAELLRLMMEAIDLTADMNARLREMTAHVLETEARVLSELKAAVDKAQA